MSVWASVNVSADVEPISLPDDSSLAPLDMIILFDSLLVGPDYIFFSETSLFG
jgi:hypothetical protein